MVKAEDKSGTDQVFSALADPSRRKVVELLHGGDATTLELSAHFDMSFQALSKHIRILEGAGIVNKIPRGKYKICSLQRDSLRSSLEWISYYSDFWNRSFDQLDKIIDEKKANERD